MESIFEPIFISETPTQLDTPAMRQYRTFKEQYPEYILLFRMGDPPNKRLGQYRVFKGQTLSGASSNQVDAAMNSRMAFRSITVGTDPTTSA